MTPTGVVFKAMQSNAIAHPQHRGSRRDRRRPETDDQFHPQGPEGGRRHARRLDQLVLRHARRAACDLRPHRARRAGQLYSNLFIKQADDAASGVARLTQGNRYWDTLPDIANDGSNYLVFASNRSDRSKPDIFRVSLVDNRLSGGHFPADQRHCASISPRPTATATASCSICPSSRTSPSRIPRSAASGSTARCRPSSQPMPSRSTIRLPTRSSSPGSTPTPRSGRFIPSPRTANWRPRS